MKKLKLHERLRLIIQCISFCFHNGYVRGWLGGKIYSGTNKIFCVPGLNCYSCPGAIGACPIGSLQAVLDSGEYKVSLYVFGFIAAIGLFCGRFVCGWLCPFGLIQDLLHRIPLFKKSKKKNMPGHKWLRWLRYGILVVFVIVLPATVMNVAGVGQPWFCEFICPSGTLLGGIPLALANASLRSRIGWRFLWKCAILVAVIVLSMKFYRPFCKYVCPLGALYGLANPISVYRLKCDGDTCIKCGACQKACGMDIKVWEKPNSLDCIRCGKCMAACPTGALTSTFNLKKKPAPGEEKTKVTLSAEDAVSGITETALVVECAAPVAECAAPVAESVVTETVAADAATAAEAAPEAAAAPAKKSGKAAVAVGILCLILAAVTIGISVSEPAIILLYIPPENLMTAIIYFLPTCVALAPAVMVLILGIRLLQSAKHPELKAQLLNWPRNVLLTVLGAFIAGSALYIAAFVLQTGPVPLVLAVVPMQLLKMTYKQFLLCAVAGLLAFIPLHKTKKKKA